MKRCLFPSNKLNFFVVIVVIIIEVRREGVIKINRRSRMSRHFIIIDVQGRVSSISSMIYGRPLSSSLWARILCADGIFIFNKSWLKAGPVEPRRGLNIVDSISLKTFLNASGSAALTTRMNRPLDRTWSRWNLEAR